MAFGTGREDSLMPALGHPPHLTSSLWLALASCLSPSPPEGPQYPVLNAQVPQAAPHRAMSLKTCKTVLRCGAQTTGNGSMKWCKVTCACKGLQAKAGQSDKVSCLSESHFPHL